MKEFQYAIATYDGITVEAGFLNHTHGHLEQILASAGREGWELCATLPSPTQYVIHGSLALIFKRPKQED